MKENFSPRIVLLVLTLAVSGCTGQGSVSTTTNPAETSAAIATVAPTTSTTEAQPVLAADSQVPDNLRSDIEALVLATQEVRQLLFLTPPRVTVLTPEKLEQRVREDVAEELEGVEVDQTVYQLLGLLPVDSDLVGLYLDLYGSSVGGFYDGDTGELVVPAAPNGFTALQRSTLIHELTHALTDQHFSMWATYQTLLDDERFDESTALLSVIEGDAVLSEVLFAQRMTDEEREELFRESFEIDDSTLQATPLFIRDALVFPYSDGFEFVFSKFQEGGHDAVDGLYRDPPLSTEEIFTSPHRQFPIALDDAPLEIDGYTVDSNGSWGALSWKLMFDQVIKGSQPAVEGWGGDQGVIYTDGSNVVLTIAYNGDTPRDVDEMLVALEQYFTTISGSEGEKDALATVFEEPGFASFGVSTSGGLVLVVASDAALGADVYRRLAG